MLFLCSGVGADHLTPLSTSLIHAYPSSSFLYSGVSADHLTPLSTSTPESSKPASPRLSRATSAGSPLIKGQRQGTNCTPLLLAYYIDVHL